MAPHGPAAEPDKVVETIIKVDESLCIGCGSCIRPCPGGPINKDDLQHGG
jgi:NAD-dependent dihydropyrimidine dehydrogenase PreA subunit